MLQPRLTIDFESQKAKPSSEPKSAQNHCCCNRKCSMLEGLPECGIGASEMRNEPLKQNMLRIIVFVIEKLSVFEGLRESGFGLTKWRNLPQS